MAEEGMAAAVTAQAEGSKYGGKFRSGYDPRRHVFTRAECQRGYWAAWESLERRFPDCDPHFLLCAIIGSRPWHTLPEIRRLLERDEPLDEMETCALFAREEEAVR